MTEKLKSNDGTNICDDDFHTAQNPSDETSALKDRINLLSDANQSKNINDSNSISKFSKAMNDNIQ